MKTDRRRRRWIAFDSAFFDGTVGIVVREKFGPTGVTVFVAWLCACKRNLVPGQVEYGSEPDALSQFGLPGLVLINEDGEAWTLKDLWTVLAAHKQCTTRSRGRLVQVRSTNWERWQEDTASHRAGPKNRRSGPTNAPETADESRSVPQNCGAIGPAETDTDTDTDTPPPLPPPTPSVGAGREEEEDVVARACQAIAKRRLSGRSPDLPAVNDRASWLQAAARRLRDENADQLSALVAQGATEDALIAALDPPPQRAPSPYAKTADPVFDEHFNESTGQWEVVRVGA